MTHKFWAAHKTLRSACFCWDRNFAMVMTQDLNLGILTWSAMMSSEACVWRRLEFSMLNITSVKWMSRIELIKELWQHFVQSILWWTQKLTSFESTRLLKEHFWDLDIILKINIPIYPPSLVTQILLVSDRSISVLK